MADYYPVQTQAELPDGGLKVELRFSNNGWLERLVMRLGGYAKLLEPDALAEEVRARASAALRNYEN